MGCLDAAPNEQNLANNCYARRYASPPADWEILTFSHVWSTATEYLVSTLFPPFVPGGGMIGYVRLNGGSLGAPATKLSILIQPRTASETSYVRHYATEVSVCTIPVPARPPHATTFAIDLCADKLPTAPTMLWDTDYWLAICVERAPGELNLENNCENLSITTPAVPDWTLQAPQVTVDGSPQDAGELLLPGQHSDFQVDIKNLGGITASPTTLTLHVRYVYASDPDYQNQPIPRGEVEGDKAIKLCAIPVVPQANTSAWSTTLNFSCTLPEDLPYDLQWWLVGCLDAAPNEQNLANNCYARRYASPSADWEIVASTYSAITFSELYYPTPLTPGGKVRFSVHVSAWPLGAPATKLSILLQPRLANVDHYERDYVGETKMCSIPVPAQQPYSSQSIVLQQTCRIPEAIAWNTDYWLTMCLEPPAGEHPYNFGNNCSTQRITIPAKPVVTVSGGLSYERIHPTASGGLDLSNITNDPIRGVPVEVLDSSGVVLATGQTDDSGNYAISLLLPKILGESIRLRALAQLKSETPSWNVAVQDDSKGYATYTLVSTPTTLPTSWPVASWGTPLSITSDLHARSLWEEWSNSDLTLLPRAAAPFAIVDTLYGALQKLAAIDSGLAIPRLTVAWRVDSISEADYDPSRALIVLRGSRLFNTDEYDAPVILHEFAHHVEETASRSDSPGGSHNIGYSLDMRLAFSEGMATALGSMFANDPFYFNSIGPAVGWSINIETYQSPKPGWFNELSVASILYDLFDAQDESGIDTVTLGLSPIYDVLVNEHRTGIPYNSIFTFITALKAKQPSQAAAIDTLVAEHSITAIDAYGRKETNSAGQGSDVLPVYTPLIAGNAAATARVANICISTEFGTKNKLSNNRFLRIDTVAGVTYDIGIQFASGTLPADSDSYLSLSKTNAYSCVDSSPALSCGRVGNGTFSFRSSSGGTHVMVLYEASARAQGTGKTCYTITALKR